jgi:formylmethanofuran dehydrogenase subunit E
MKVTLSDYSVRKFSIEEFWAVFNHNYLQVMAETPAEERYARAAQQAKQDSIDFNHYYFDFDRSEYAFKYSSLLWAWQRRESQRTQGVVCERLIEALGERYKSDTFLHQSETDHAQVAYTKSLLDGLANKQTRCSPGRYLKAVYDLPDHEIGDILRQIESPSRPLHVWTTREQINQCFETRLSAEGAGGCSCMVGKFSDWRGDRPYHIYADHSELCVVVQLEGSDLEGSDVVARSVAFRDTKEYVRVYAKDESLAARMHEDLKLEGWKKLDGARDVKVAELRRNGRVLCPYIDWDGDVRTYNGTYLKTENTDGYGDEGTTCSNCDCECEDDHQSYEGTIYCSECFNDRYSYCEHCDEYSNSNDFSNVDDEYVCHSCARDANECDKCSKSTFERLNSVSSEDWCQECTDNHSSTCDHCSDTVPANDTQSVGDDTWCDSCVISDAVSCAECSETLPRDDAKTAQGEYYCEGCFETVEQLELTLES